MSDGEELTPEELAALEAIKASLEEKVVSNPILDEMRRDGEEEKAQRKLRVIVDRAVKGVTNGKESFTLLVCWLKGQWVRFQRAMRKLEHPHVLSEMLKVFAAYCAYILFYIVVMTTIHLWVAYLALAGMLASLFYLVYKCITLTIEFFKWCDEH